MSTIKKFTNNQEIAKLATKYQTPFYLYDKKTILNNIQELKNISTLPNYQLNYATKANSNIHILKIMQQQNLKVDATGYGEVFINQQAGFTNDNIYVVGNNFTPEELQQIIQQNLIISLDALDQIKMLGELKNGYQKVMLRLNPSFGAGANSSVTTGGYDHKFGIDYQDLDLALNLLQKYNLKLIGLNQHIGSAYLEDESLLKGVTTFLDFILEKKVTGLNIIDFGGGFGLNYKRNHNNQEMDLNNIKTKINIIFDNFLQKYDNKNVSLEFEPGRYLVANSAILVGQVTSIKQRGDKHFIGTDLGFTQMIRPTLYNSYHEVEFITTNTKQAICNIVGNICESGDYMAKERLITIPNVGDLIIVYDVGAYGYCLTSNYNNRLKPIELLQENNDIKIIRNRQTLHSLLSDY